MLIQQTDRKVSNRSGTLSKENCPLLKRWRKFGWERCSKRTSVLSQREWMRYKVQSYSYHWDVSRPQNTGHRFNDGTWSSGSIPDLLHWQERGFTGILPTDQKQNNGGKKKMEENVFFKQVFYSSILFTLILNLIIFEIIVHLSFFTSMKLSLFILVFSLPLSFPCFFLTLTVWSYFYSLKFN